MIFSRTFECGCFYIYDPSGRISVYSTPEGAVSFNYDDNGNIIRSRDKEGSITRTFDALNRVTSCTDTYGKTIGYEYDEVGDLRKIIYPDNTEVNYEYDENHNLTKVTDWANRVTEYTYDKNNRVERIDKPNGTVVSTIYEHNKVKSTVEKTAQGQIILGFEYTYDNLSRIVEEKVLANSTRICYTYDELNRVVSRTVRKLSDNSVISTENFTYDYAGNITDATGHCFAYGSNNRLVTFDGQGVSYDADGNMTFGNSTCCTYDSLNRLTSAGAHDYTYNAENVRIRNLCEDEDTVYTYDTNCKLSRLLVKTTNNVVTKYVYGLGLIGEETNNVFTTYHFDSRGSTIALTNMSGTVTDTFAYDTYGKLLSRTGTSDIIFGYNGRDGVVTDKNGLIYMRARYYSPDMKRFINADIIAGTISNATTLNRYAYANANPVMFIDPLGLYYCGRCGDAGCDACLDKDTLIKVQSGEIPNPNKSTENGSIIVPQNNKPSNSWDDDENGEVVSKDDYYGNKKNSQKTTVNEPINPDSLEKVMIKAKEETAEMLYDKSVDWATQKMDSISGFDDMLMPGKSSTTIVINGTVKTLSIATSLYNLINDAQEGYENGYTEAKITYNMAIDIAIDVSNSVIVSSATAIGASIGTTLGFPGTVVGGVVGFTTGITLFLLYDVIEWNNEMTAREIVKSMTWNDYQEMLA